MNTSNRIVIRSKWTPLFERAANIAHWPDILPHYRWVKVLERRGDKITAEMAARHKGVPLWWKTIQIPLPEERRILFTHIGGVTTGMAVEWTFTELTPDEGVPTWLVQIHHHFDPEWPEPGPWIAERIIGNIFIKQVANKTLACMKLLAESGT